MFSFSHRPSWLSSLTAAFIVGLTTLLSGCGGGGTDPVEQSATMSVVPGSAVVYAYADVPTTLTIRNGVGPYNVYSDNAAVINFNQATMPAGLVPDQFITLGGPAGQYGRVENVDADTIVILTVRDSKGTQVNVPVTVKPSSLNESLTVTGTTTTGGTQPGVVSSGTQGTVTVRATNIHGGVIEGHQVRFDNVKGAYSFICPAGSGNVCSADGLSVTTVTDRNGDATVLIKANVNAPTQYATVRATDLVSGHSLTRQFVIAGAVLSALPTTVTWTFTGRADDPTTPADETITFGDVCTAPADPVAITDYTIYGGTPPYTATTSSPSIAVLAAAGSTTFGNTATVADSGGTFRAAAACSATGDATITIRDSAGAIITVTFKVEFKTS